MYEFYTKQFEEKALRRSRKELKRLYDEIPETTGCMTNIAKEDGCKAWCCELQSPQVMFSEFMLTWQHVIRNWTADDITQLVMSATIAYLNNNSMGCVFFDKEKRLCRQHETRPFNCRTYGQIPDEEFKPRYEQLKVLYPDKEFRDQCNLVETVGTKPTEAEMDLWFHHLNLIEKELLGKNAPSHDGQGGTYRTYKDHILLKLGNEKFLLRLTRLRQKGTTEEKETFLKELEVRLKKNLTAEQAGKKK